MFFRISCFVRFDPVLGVPYQALALLAAMNAPPPVVHEAAKSRIACMDIGDVGTAPAVTALVDGNPSLQVADPVLRLSTIGHTAVVSMLNVPRLLCCRKVDGGFTEPIFVD